MTTKTTKTTKTIKNSETIIINDWPWGFHHKTTKTHAIDFKESKGFRIVTQTVNPKTKKPCAFKKSTYSDIMWMIYKNDGKIATSYTSFNNELEKLQGPQGICALVDNNIRSFDSVLQLKYLSSLMITCLKSAVKSKIIYTGAEIEDIGPLYKEALSMAFSKYTDPQKGITFSEIVSTLDIVKIDACSKPGYNPFKSEFYEVGSNGLVKVA